jgi:chromate transporter
MQENSPQQDGCERIDSIGFWDAFKFWLKLGFISFGGPAGQISTMHHELVEKRKWISDKRFMHALNFCMVLPGPEAQQLATYLGWLMHRTLGGITAGVLFVLPSFLILILLSTLYMVYGHLSWVEGLLQGLKPAVSAIVFQAAYRIGIKTLKNWVLMLIALASFVAINQADAPFPLILLVAALLGAWGGRFNPSYFSWNSHAKSSKISTERAIIDDDTPVPEHALIAKTKLFKIALIGLLLWLVPILLMVWSLGQDHILTQMSWFFTKAALLTFGGAYAVLPYVYQGAVTSFEWITPSQMLDGLALGETTPGPLIIVITFVGFVAGYAKSFMGLDMQWLSGILAAITVTWFTFLPSFVFIFLGGPFIEATHQQLRLTAPLNAMTAAIVGVILNLAFFLGLHVLVPDGLVTGLNVFATCVFLVSLLALIVFKQSVIRVILFASLVGCTFKYLQWSF